MPSKYGRWSKTKKIICLCSHCYPTVIRTVITIFEFFILARKTMNFTNHWTSFPVYIIFLTALQDYQSHLLYNIADTISGTANKCHISDILPILFGRLFLEKVPRWMSLANLHGMLVQRRYHMLCSMRFEHLGTFGKYCMKFHSKR